MKKITHILAFVLILAISISAFPVMAFADHNEFLEVLVDGAPIRNKDSEKGTVVAKCFKGAVLESTGSTINKYLHKWYKVRYDGSTYYIYSDNVKKHAHNYQALKIEDVNFKICKNCGDIAGNNTKSSTYKEYVSYAALVLPALDGPIPVGDILAALLATYAGTTLLHSATPSITNLVEQVKEIDFSEYLRKRESNNCSYSSFRRVIRFPGGLKYLDDKCMDVAEAFIWVAAFQGDVYTADEDAALILAAMSPWGATCERDKDKVSYFYHYHLCLSVNRTQKGHVFFGTNDLGETPI